MKEMKKAKKAVAIMMFFMVLSTLTIPANAEDAEIQNGSYTITADGTYQLAEGYSGIITIASNVNEVTVADTAFKTLHSGTSIVVAGGRTTALELTIKDISFSAAAGYSGIDFGNAGGGYENKLYISGTCSVTGGDHHAGIHVPDGVILVIDKLQDDESDQLNVAGGKIAAAIGGDIAGTGGTITINGGTVNAKGGSYIDETTGDGSGGAGIGGGGWDSSGAPGGGGGTITINGGTVNAKGGKWAAAGIGGGFCGAGGIVTINGGTVTADGADSEGTGIGSGCSGAGGTVIINDGTVNATGYNWSPGIGTGYTGWGGSVTINGGTVTAKGGQDGAAGIGGGRIYAADEKVGDVTINGGTIIAIGGAGDEASFKGGGAGIGIGSDGFGYGNQYGPIAPIKITGGTITAVGGLYAAGIGCSISTPSGNINISGGTITATGGKYGMGIGGITKSGPNGTVTISGKPKIIATANSSKYKAKHICATLKDSSGADLSYLRIDAGVSGVNITLDGSSDIYTTDDNGNAGIFVSPPCSATYTASKAGYSALRNTQVVSSMCVCDVIIPMIADNTPPLINHVTQTLIKKGASIDVSFTDDYGIYGMLYLVPKADAPYTSKSALNGAAVKKEMAINSPATTASLDTTGLDGGSYEIYLIDSAENISAPANLVIDNSPPVIKSATVGANGTYIDLMFDEGVYGSDDGASKLNRDDLQVKFSDNGGTATAASITAVKKNDNTDAGVASELAGGESIVRVFFNVTGIPSGTETVEFKPADSSSIYDKVGNVMAADQTSSPVLLKDSQAPAVSNETINVTNTTQTGAMLSWSKASDSVTSKAALEYSVYQSASDNLNTVAEILANGTLIQSYSADTTTLSITGLQSGSTYYFNIIVRDNAGNKTCYKKAVVTTASSGGAHHNGGGTTNAASDKTEKENEITIPIRVLTGEPGKFTEAKIKYAAFVIPSNMLTKETAGNAVSATISAGIADTAMLPVDVRAQIGGKSVIELTLKLDGRTVAWNNPDAPVTVSIPYTPTAEELANPEKITVWYIDGQGNIVPVPNGRYDPTTGTVKFTTTHFSKFAIAYVKTSFNDLGNVDWAKKSIEVLASKGILKGISNEEYAPQTYITRADFLYFLIRTLDVDKKVDANFDDISKDAYYYNEIAIAKKIGITDGIGNNKFNPDANIRRQDMIVLTRRALILLDKLNVQGTASDLDQFTDKSLVAQYAVNSIASFIKEGLIVGNGNKINPLGNTTRAEAAVFLYRIYNE